MKNGKKLIFFTVLFFGLLLTAGVTFAAGSASQTLGQAVSSIFSWALGIAVISAVIAVAAGGVFYIIASATGKFKSESVDWIKAGITGLIITLSAYAIAYTINPQLLNFNINQLVTGTLPGSSSSGGSGPNIENYDEIPIGTLTEKLLTTKMNCYDFDPEGDPIPGEEMTDDSGNKFLGPTDTDHDRVDCYLKYADAAEKKALAAEELAQKINELMAQCSCATYGNCQDPCNNNQPSSNSLTQTGGPGCILAPTSGNCNNNTCGNPATAGCALPPAMTNTALGGSQPTTALSCCPPEIKNEIKGYLNEHGDGPDNEPTPTNNDPTQTVEPIVFPLTQDCTDGSCTDDTNKSYFGLDEFYTEESASDIIDQVEKTTQVNKEDFTYINLDDCPTCDEDCDCAPDDNTCLANQSKCEDEKQQCIDTDRPECLAKQPWYKLNLVEQLTYLQQKMGQIKSDITHDSEALTSAEGQLENCSLSKSYIDLRQTDAATDADNTMLNINPYNGPASEENPSQPTKVDIAQYCNGFNYNNSTGYQQCSDECPITADTQVDTDYKDTSPPSSSSSSSSSSDSSSKEGIFDCYNDCNQEYNCDPTSSDYQTCQADNSQCTTDCYDNRICTLVQNDSDNSGDASGTGDSSDTTETFNDCTNDYTDNCQNLCEEKYLPCSEQYTACNTMCNDDSQCVLNNVNTCVLNPTSFAGCQNAGDTDAINNCIQNSYTCKAGSQQNAGYPDCLINPTTQTKFSASWIYQNPDQQVCQYPNAKISAFGIPITNSCVEANPQTAKCPASSNCPDCSCDSINENFSFSFENPVYPREVNACLTGGGAVIAPVPPACTTTNYPVQDYRIVGPECMEPAFNDDPLTFYCRQDWWNEPDSIRPAPTGQSMVCNQSTEVPVGNTVDDAVTWANNFLDTAGEISTNLQHLVSDLGQISTNTTYCECDSKYESGDPVCRACCIYKGSYQIGVVNPITIPASCNYQSCTGNSCQQMINWLEAIQDYHTEIKQGMVNLFVSLADDPRTDVLKELTYSRQQVNTCSAAENQTSAASNRLLSCQRILDDIISPETLSNSKTDIAVGTGSSTTIEDIYHYCYGQMAGQILGASNVNSDNWFCCQSTNTNNGASKNTINPNSPAWTDTSGLGVTSSNPYGSK